MKHVKVEYIESGTFQGGEEDVSKAGIEFGEDCIVIRKEDFAKAKDALKFLRVILEQRGAFQPERMENWRKARAGTEWMEATDKALKLFTK